MSKRKSTGEEIRVPLVIDDRPAVDGLKRIGKESARQMGKGADETKKLEAAIKRLNTRTAFAKAKLSSEEFLAAQRANQQALAEVRKRVKGVNDEAKRGGGGFAAMAGGIGAAVTGLDTLITRMAQAVAGIRDFAMAGAEANDIEARFNAQMRGGADALDAFRKATAHTIDATSLQNSALVAMSKDGLALTQEQFKDLAREVTALSAEYGKNVNKMMAGTLKLNEQTREIGIEATALKAKYKGLSEVEQKRAILLELAARGAKRTDEELQSQTNTIQAAATSWADLVSTVQQWTANILVDSGALDGFKKLVEELADAFEKNKEEIAEFLESGVKALVDILPALSEGISKTAEQLKTIAPLLVGIGKAFEALSGAQKALVELTEGLGTFGKMAEYLIDPVGGLGQAIDEAASFFSGDDGGGGDLASAAKMAEQALRDASGVMPPVESALRKMTSEQQEAAKAAFTHAAGLHAVNEEAGFLSGKPSWANKKFGSYGTNARDSMGARFDAAAAHRDSALSQARADAVNMVTGRGGIGGGSGGAAGVGFGGSGALGGAFGGALASGQAQNNARGLFGQLRLVQGANSAGDIGGVAGGGIVGQLAATGEGIADMLQPLQEAQNALQDFGTAAEDSLVGAFGGAVEAALSGTNDFDQQMRAVFGKLTSDLAAAFAEWAAFEIAAATGLPWAGALAAAGLKAAGKALSSHITGPGSRASTASASGVQRALSREQEKDDYNRETHIYWHGIPVPDKTATEIMEAVERGKRLAA